MRSTLRRPALLADNQTTSAGLPGLVLVWR
ncbi:hypothetical protein ACVWWQ_003106 [Rhodanobacter sp. TND4EL1]